MYLPPDRLEPGLDRGRGDVLAAGGLEQLLDPPGDREVAGGVEGPLVAGAQPSVGRERRGGLVRQVVVAVHDARPADLDLVVRAEARLGAGEG
jgi:hypothetical protein